MRFDTLQRIKQCRGADQFEHFVHASATSLLLDFSSDGPVVDDHAAGASVSQQLRSRFAAARGDYSDAVIHGDGGCGQANTSRAASNKQRFAFLQLKSIEQRAIRCLQHLAAGTEDLPWESGAQFLDLGCWNDCAFRLWQCQHINRKEAAGVDESILHSHHHTPCPSRP